MIAPWLVTVLDRELPDLAGGERDRIAQAIVDALPAQMIATAIRDSTTAVLIQRNVLDRSGELARELSNNSAQTVIFALSLPEFE